MAIEDGYTGQGYSISQLALFDLSGNRLLELASGIELHSDNQGACGPETSKCWDVSGQFSFVAPKTAGASYDDLLLVFSGESSVARENGKPQPDADDIARDTTTLKGQARYAYDGKQYRLIEGENIVPGV